MGNCASTIIDRRAQYYARYAALIAADPLDFYSRAEKGRKLQVSRLRLSAVQAARVVPFLRNTKREKNLPIQRHAALLGFRESATIV